MELRPALGSPVTSHAWTSPTPPLAADACTHTAHGQCSAMGTPRWANPSDHLPVTSTSPRHPTLRRSCCARCKRASRAPQRWTSTLSRASSSGSTRHWCRAAPDRPAERQARPPPRAAPCLGPIPGASISVCLQCTVESVHIHLIRISKIVLFDVLLEVFEFPRLSSAARPYCATSHILQCAYLCHEGAGSFVKKTGDERWGRWDRAGHASVGGAAPRGAKGTEEKGLGSSTKSSRKGGGYLRPWSAEAQRPRC